MEPIDFNLKEKETFFLIVFHRRK